MRLDGVQSAQKPQSAIHCPADYVFHTKSEVPNTLAPQPRMGLQHKLIALEGAVVQLVHFAYTLFERVGSMGFS